MKKQLNPIVPAYLAGTNDHPYYEGIGIDDHGNRFLIRWEIRDDYDPTEQLEDMACDWDNFRVIEQIL